MRVKLIYMSYSYHYLSFVDCCPLSPRSASSRERLLPKELSLIQGARNNRRGEMEPLTELPSSDERPERDVRVWLESSSRYQACEVDEN